MTQQMKHFISIEDCTKEELDELLDLAQHYKKSPYSDVLKEKVLVAQFCNPSTRTKTTFDLAMHQLGGHCVILEPGKSSWGVDVCEGCVMDGDAEEHLKDSTKVLCEYADALALRAFPQFKNWEEEKKDSMLMNMVKWSSKPVINMETISHPCQALAMMQAIKSKMNPKGKKFVLTWAYHPKPLNTAVANSAGVIASMYGMDIVIAHPKGYDLDPHYITIMKEHCEKNGATFSVTHDMEDAFVDADYVYIKSWGSLQHYGSFDVKENMEEHHSHNDWIVTQEKMALTNNAYVSHCLPVRRNMLVSDEVLDSDQSLIYEEAANRLHVQKAVLTKLLVKK